MNRKLIRWSLFAIIILYIISGFGITQFRVVETVTLGVLTKPLSFRIHDYLLFPFIVLLTLHMYMILKSQVLRLSAFLRQQSKKKVVASSGYATTRAR